MIMKTMSKALIAVMIAAAMCIVPLFVIEDSAATEVKTGDIGVSFKAGEISKENFEKLMPVESYEEFATEAMGAIGISSTSFNITDVKVTAIKDVKTSLGSKVTDSKLYQTKGTAVKVDIEFVATYDSLLSCDLFKTVDGTQELYKEIGTNQIVSGNTLTFKGTVTMEEMSGGEQSFEKTYGENVVVTGSEGKTSAYAQYKGDVTFKNSSGEYKIAVDGETGRTADTTSEYDFYGVKIADLKADSKVIITNKVTGAMKTSVSYDYKGNKSSYESYQDLSLLMGGSTYRQTVVLDIIAPATVECEPYVYYDNDATIDWSGDVDTVGLFNNLTVQDSELKDNDKMKEFLEKIGSVGNSYSDADSVANGAYENVIESSGNGGGSNVIFYVIIGVLAVAVVALAVLLIKKK